MKISLLPPEKPDLFDLYQCNVITLEDTSSNICENEGLGLTPSGHTHYLNMVFKTPLVTLKQGVWHEGVGPAPQFSHMF